MEHRPTALRISPTDEELTRYARGSWYARACRSTVERALDARVPIALDARGIRFAGEDLGLLARHAEIAASDKGEFSVTNLPADPHETYTQWRRETPYESPRFD